jgi:hypothetical protein
VSLSAPAEGMELIEPSGALNDGLTPDEVLDARVNGNRADLETHTLTRGPIIPGGSTPLNGGDIERPRRRRRKGRGLRGHLVTQGSNGPEGPDSRFGGRPGVEAWRSGGPAAVGAIAPQPGERAEQAPGGGGRRRRRRRRGRGEARSDPAASMSLQDGMTAGAGPVGGEVFDGAKTPLAEGHESPVETDFPAHLEHAAEATSGIAPSDAVAEALEAGTVGSALEPDLPAPRARRTAKRGGRRRPGKPRSGLA